MRRNSVPKRLRTSEKVGPGEARRLSIIHAEALYRLIPPVEFDDEGYPYGDGKRPESTKHGRTLMYGLAAAGVLLNHLPDALVAYDLLFLFEEGNPRAAVAPDLMVALGAGRHDRNSYKLWEEGRPTSRSRHFHRELGRRTCKSSRTCTATWVCASSSNSTRRASSPSR